MLPLPSLDPNGVRVGRPNSGHPCGVGLSCGARPRGRPLKTKAGNSVAHGAAAAGFGL